MWVKRSEWEALLLENESRDRAIKILMEEVKALKFFHDMKEPLGDGNMSLGLYSSKTLHEKIIGKTICTQTIPDLTLEELARFVIDGTPIKRKQEVDVEFRGE